MRAVPTRLSVPLMAVLLLLVLVLAPETAQLAAAAPASDDLSADLNKILNDPDLGGATIAIAVRDAGSGAVRYARDADKAVVPASNAKLLTAAAALGILGPDYRFRTSVLTTGSNSDGVVTGNLYLEGTGDPTMLVEDYDELASKVAASGVRTVRGQLVADDTEFDNVRLGLGWTWNNEPFGYSAQISALTVAANTDYDAGQVIVEIQPHSAAGKPPGVILTPATDYVTVVNRAATSAPGSAQTVTAKRQHGNNTIVVSGNIPADAQPTQLLSSVWEPTGYAADVFRKALRKHGVQVFGRTVLGAATPDSATELAAHESIPLSRLLVPFLKLSNNGHAEVLIKAMGRKVSDQGTWDAGIQAMSDYLETLGVDPEKIQTADGSGLSRMDLVTPEQLTTLLITARDKEWFPTLYNALPIAGQPDRLDGGTLRQRMDNTAADGNVHAKTGSLTGVSALSGYVTNGDGKPLVFSIVFNNFINTSTKDIEDAIAVRLASKDDAEPLLPSVRTHLDIQIDVECSWIFNGC